MKTLPNKRVNRRTILATGAALGGLGVLSSFQLPIARGAAGQFRASSTTQIHRVTQQIGFPVNAYLVESETSLVLIDALLTVTDATALRAQIDGMGKPLSAVLLTHPHPDHYAGLGIVTAGLDVPIVAVSGVNNVVRRDDDEKNTLIGGMFGPEWPTSRVFPTQIAADGDALTFGDLTFTVHDIGPAESFHDSLFTLEGANVAFIGDLVYGLMHPYMADNHNPDWIAAMDRLSSELAEDTVLYIGHGQPTTPGLFQWHLRYMDLFHAAIEAADWNDVEAATAAVTDAMLRYLPNEDLLFLMQLSIVPNATRLGKL